MALCDSSVLTGQEGSISFKPPGTSACVRDFSAWGTDGTTSHITVGCGARFQRNDVVQFYEEDGGNLDSSFTASTDQSQTDYKVVGVGGTGSTAWIQVCLNSDATEAPIEVTGDGGDSGADTALPAHINIKLADWFSVCGVREFSIDISRDELDVTTLPCTESGTTDECETLAAFRSTQAGYATATGTMSVYFTCDQTTIANRLLGSSVLKNQNGAAVKLYVCTRYDSNGDPDDSESLYIEADIAITGVSFSVNPDDPTTGELSFSVRKIVSAFGVGI